MNTISRAQALAAVAAELREFGYPDATNEKIMRAFISWQSRKPHGDIVERFAFDKFAEHPSIFGQPDAPPPANLAGTPNTGPDSFEKNFPPAPRGSTR